MQGAPLTITNFATELQESTRWTPSDGNQASAGGTVTERSGFDGMNTCWISTTGCSC